MIKISVYNQSQFLKSGKLKKRAQPDFSRLIGDTGELSDKDQRDFITETAEKLIKDYTGFESPYFFTHIIGVSKANGQKVYIFEDVYINGNKFMTTPKTLLEALNK